MFITPQGNGLWLTGIFAVIYSDSIDDFGTSTNARLSAKYGGASDWQEYWRINTARPYVLPGARVLDIGCADGELFRLIPEVAEGIGVDEIVACVTSAVREADNGSDLVDRIGMETGIRPRVISGRDEARLIFAAVRASVLLDPAPALCFDLGGGSLEIMVGDRAGLLWSTSLKLGVARLTAELVDSDPLSEHDQRRLRDRLTAGPSYNVSTK